MTWNIPLAKRHLPTVQSVYGHRIVTLFLIFLVAALVGSGLAMIGFLSPVFFRAY